MSKYCSILKNRNFFLLWLGQIISQLGDRLDQMALIGFIYVRAPGSTFEIAKMLSFTIIPVFLIGPIAGVYVDRWDRRKTMYASDLIRAALVLTIPLFLFYSKSFIPIYLVIFLVFSVGRFFVPAKFSIIPDIVDKKDLVMANSLVNITGMIAAVVGLGISGVIIEWIGPRSGFYLDSVSFLLSGSLIFLIAVKSRKKAETRVAGRQIVEVFRKSVVQELREGIAYLVSKKEIRVTAAVIFILWSALGSVYVVSIAFVQNTLHSATKDLGLLGMFLGLGLFLGSLVYGKLGHGFSQYRTIFVSLVTSGLTLVMFAITIRQYPSFYTAAGLASILGFVIAPIMIASNTIVHNASEGGMMGKIFSSLEIIMHLGFILFMYISGLLAEKYSAYGTLVVVGAVVAILGLISLVCHYRIPGLRESEKARSV